MCAVLIVAGIIALILIPSDITTAIVIIAAVLYAWHDDDESRRYPRDPGNMFERKD